MADTYNRYDHNAENSSPVEIRTSESGRTTKRSEIFSTKSIKEKIRSRDRYKKCGGGEYDEASRSSTTENNIEATNPLDRESMENRHQAFPSDTNMPMMMVVDSSNNGHL